MKVNFYYVVKVHQPGVDSIGRDSDAEYVAGPFKTSEECKNYIVEKFKTYVEQSIHSIVHINTKVNVSQF